MANGRGRFRRGPSFDDRATGKFSGSPAGYSRDTGPSFSDVATGKFSGSPRGYPTPSNRQPGFGIANTRVAQGRGLGDIARNVARNVGQRAANVGRGMRHPFAMAAGSIANNRAQHAYLDEVYGKDKGAAQWDQAIDQFYDRGLYAPGSTEPTTSAIGMSFGDIEPGGGGTLGGVSFGQAKKYLNRAGISDKELQRFIQEGKSEGWLAAQVEGGKEEDFATGMSFIKNAKATANLARSTAAAGMENEMYGGRQLEGPSFDDSATRVRSYPEDTFADFRSGIEQEGGSPPYPPGVTEDITADIAGTPPGGYLDAANLISNQVGPGPWNEFDPYNTSMVPANVGGRGKSTLEEKQVFNDLYDFDTLRNPPFNVPQSYWNPDQMGYLGMSEEDEMFGTEPGMGGYDWVGDSRGGQGFYTNRIGDVIPMSGRGNIPTPNISVSFGDEERFRKSDMRLKEDIQLVGKSPSDINIYSFKYKGEPGKYEGVMAQEVPWASSVGEDGFLRVDYSKVDVDFKPIG